MKPRRTPNTNHVLRLAGGTEDNDLWVERTADEDGDPILRSVWQPTDAERRELAAGANIYLVVWGDMAPPVGMGLTTEPLGR